MKIRPNNLFLIFVLTLNACSSSVYDCSCINPAWGDFSVTASPLSVELNCTFSNMDSPAEAGFYLTDGEMLIRFKGSIVGKNIQVHLEDLTPNTEYEGKFFINDGNLEFRSGNFVFKTDDGEIPAKIVDPVFKNYLLREYDRDGNGLLSRSELSTITNIDVRTDSIGSLEGLKYMPNLRSLTAISEFGTAAGCLTELDLSANTFLENVTVFGNQLKSLDVSMLPYLTSLNCSQNNLTEIDVSNNPELVYFWCNDCYLKEIDLTANTHIKVLWVSGNRMIDYLRLPNPGIMVELDISNTKITDTDLSTMPRLRVYSGNGTRVNAVPDFSCNPFLESIAIGYEGGARLLTDEHFFADFLRLKSLQCSGYSLEHIDLSANTSLEYIWIECSDNLKELDLSHCPDIKGIGCSYDRALQTIYIHPEVDPDLLSAALLECPAKIVVK